MGFINAIFIAIMGFGEGYTAIGVLAIIWAVLSLLAQAANK